MTKFNCGVCGNPIETVAEACPKCGEKVAGLADLKGERIATLDRFIQENNDYFENHDIPEDRLTACEKIVWSLRSQILELVGGMPKVVRGIHIAEQIRKPSYLTTGKTCGVWDLEESKTYILRETLASLQSSLGFSCMR